MITKAGKVMTKKFLFISSFFYLAAAALPMTEARAADPDTDPVNITCPGGSCDNPCCPAVMSQKRLSTPAVQQLIPIHIKVLKFTETAFRMMQPSIPEVIC